MKKFLLISNCLLMPMLAANFVSCGQPDNNILDSIKIMNDVDDFNLEIGQQIKTQPIEIKCFNKNQEEIIGIETKLALSDASGKQLPDWIYINSNNQICIFNEQECGHWAFNLVASHETIQSQTITFNVDIYDPTIPPDELVIDCQDEIDLLSPTTNCFTIGLFAYKDGQIDPTCNKNCKWEIAEIKSNSKNEIPLIYLDDLSTSASLYIDVNKPDVYDGDYTIILEAESKVCSVTATKEIILSVSNGSSYIDPDTNYQYTREPSSSWVLSSVPIDTKQIVNVKEKISGIPVYKVADNLLPAPGNEEAKLESVELPSSITEIGVSAFENQKNLTTITMPGVKTVNANAFSGCTNMSLSPFAPEPQISSIGQRSFYGCKKIEFNTAQRFETLDSESFAESGISKMIIPPYCLARIKDKAFENCTNLKAFIIYSNVPPYLLGQPFKNYPSEFRIYVPLAGKNNYLTAQGWSNYKNIITTIE